MKKYIYIAAIALSAVTLTGCEDFLDSENITEANTSNFPTNPADAEKQLTAVYSTLNDAIVDIPSHYFFVSEIVNDDRFASGGEDDSDTQALSHFMKQEEDIFEPFWSARYTGISRANSTIESLLAQEAAFTDVVLWKQYLGEAYFLRAYFYHELAEMFGGVPLITSTAQETNAPRATAEELYGQIASDLKTAIELMDNAPYTKYASGHATKWAAEALMARVFLFYTGFYEKESLPLASTAEGEAAGSVTKTEVIDWIDDCIANSGHALVSDYRNLWAYTNEYTVGDYEYTKDVIGVDGQPLKWAGNGNEETVFAVKFSNSATWSATGNVNRFCLYFGLRGHNGVDEGTFPFGYGWGIGTVTPNLWNDWAKDEPNDLRREASISDVFAELPGYKLDGDNHVEETGYWNKKMVPVQAKGAVVNNDWQNAIFWKCYPGFNDSNVGNYTGAHLQDLLVIRFADVLLMQSELKGDVTGINKVRQRAGLPTISSYTLEALQKERRYELCFEGRRWADIRRWRIAEEALSKKNGAKIFNKTVETTMRDGKYAERYQATKGFFYLPKSQVDLSAGVLEQNPGWDTPDALFSNWSY